MLEAAEGRVCMSSKWRNAVCNRKLNLHRCPDVSGGVTWRRIWNEETLPRRLVHSRALRVVRAVMEDMRRSETLLRDGSSQQCMFHSILRENMFANSSPRPMPRITTTVFQSPE